MQLYMNLLLSFLIPLTVQSQELTESQRSERCENNRNRVDKLKSELQVINAELSNAWSDSEIQNARTDMVNVRNKLIELDKNGGVLEVEYSYLYKVIDRYNYPIEKCKGENRIVYDCFYDFGKYIGKKIDKAVSLKSKRPKLITDKAKTEKQIKDHETNLIALGCSYSQGDCLVPLINGKYKTAGDPAGILVFSQSGSHVTGIYGATENTLVNTLEGDFKCGILTGTFTNTVYKVTGTFTYYFSADGSSYTGTWKNDKDKRTGPAGGTRQ